MDGPDESWIRRGQRAAFGRRGRSDLPGRPHAVPDPTPHPDHVERQALQAAQHGDNRAFARLIRTHDPALRTVATFLVGPESVERVLHDAYLKAFRSLPLYRGDVPPRLWLTRPVVSLSLDHLRKRHRSRPRRAASVRSPAAPPLPSAVRDGEAGDKAPDPESGVRIIPADAFDEEDVDGSDDPGAVDPERPNRRNGPARRDAPVRQDGSPLGRLHQALDSLLLEDRIALTLVDVAGLTVAEAADTIEVEQPTMATRLGRARTGVQRALEQLAAEASTKVWTPPATPDPHDLPAWFDLQPVPNHGEEFWSSVGKKLLDAKYRPAALGPGPGRVGGVETKGGPVDGAQPKPEATVKVGSGAEDHTIDSLADRARTFRAPSTGRLRRLALVVVVVLALGGLVGGAFAIAGKVTHRDAQLGLTPSKVVSRVNDALSTDQQVSGTVTVDSGGSPVAAGSYAFVRGADGSYKITASDGHWSEAYDAQSGTFTTVGTPSGGTPVNLVQTGMAPGPPDRATGIDHDLGDPLTGVVRVMAQGHNAKVTTLGDNGAPQYVLDSDLSLSDSDSAGSGAGVFAGSGAFAVTGGADHIRVVIDQSLQLPTDVQLTRDQGSVMHLRFVNLAVGDTAGPGSFQLPAPAGGQTINHGFQVVQLNQVAGLVGYQPLTPEYLPRAFTLASVAVLPHATAGDPSTAGGRNPPNEGVVALTYRHGADSVVVTTRKFTSQPGRLWLDPFAREGEGANDAVALTAGHFLQVGAHAGSDPVRHVWGHDRQLVFTVAGTVSTSDLERVASSLH